MQDFVDAKHVFFDKKIPNDPLGNWAPVNRGDNLRSHWSIRKTLKAEALTPQKHNTDSDFGPFMDSICIFRCLEFRPSDSWPLAQSAVSWMGHQVKTIY